MTISFAPKLFENFNGSAAHTNFSTKTMRDGTGNMDYIFYVIKKLEDKHMEHMAIYGDNSRRMTGKHETSKKDEFSSGVGNRAASIRIPTQTMNAKKGYLEDRRPASDIDAYVVTAMIADTIILE